MDEIKYLYSLGWFISFWEVYFEAISFWRDQIFQKIMS